LKANLRRATGTPPHARAPQLPAAPKARGELAEARFLAKAMSLGFVVNKPFGDSARYDFVVDAGGRLTRVQVKSTWAAKTRCHCYGVSAVPSQPRKTFLRQYGRNEIDFLAAYLAPEDTWFIIPVDILPAHKVLTISTRPNRRYGCYREAWGLLGGARG
jgi:PD-(D/E)XK endonuclease